MISLDPIRKILRDRRRAGTAKRLAERARKNASGNVLTAEEKAEAVLFYRNTTGKTINTVYHNYLKDKSGVFHR